MLPVAAMLETSGLEGALLLWLRTAARAGGLTEEASASLQWCGVFGSSATTSSPALTAILKTYGSNDVALPAEELFSILQRMNTDEVTERVASSAAAILYSTLAVPAARRRAALQLQKRFVVMRSRKLLKRMRLDAKASRIQAIARGKQARKRMHAQLIAVRTIRSWTRSAIIRRRFVSLRKAAVHIAAHTRTMQAKRILAASRFAASRLAASSRRMIARNQLQTALMAATRLEAVCRGRSPRLAFVKARAAAIHMQSVARRASSTRMLKAAITASVSLQAAWRGATARVLLGVQQLAATDIQAASRRLISRRVLATARAAATTIASAERCRAAKAFFITSVLQATLLQTVARGMIARRLLKTIKAHAHALASIVTIQKAMRRFVAVANLATARKAVTTIQAATRRTAAVRTLQTAKTSATMIQAYQRRDTSRRLLATARTAATTIAAAERCRSAKAVLITSVLQATLLQTSWRRHRIVIQWSHAKRSVIVLQSAVRRMLVKTNVKALIQRRRKAAVTMQRMQRGVKAREMLASWHAAATTIAKHVRGNAALIDYFLSYLAVIELQRIARGRVGRNDRAKRSHAVQKLQAMARGKSARTLASRSFAARRLQAATRGKKARAMATRIAAARSIQAVTRRHRAQQFKRRAVAAASTLQKHMRRRQLYKRAKTVVVRIQRAARHFLHGELIPYRYRVLHACYTMRHQHGQLDQATAACLDLSVLHTNGRCRYFAMELSLYPLLLKVVNSCNRSPHSMALLKLALPLTTALVKDESCRSFIASFVELTSVMVKTLVNHLNNAQFFGLAADCLLAAAADPRMRAELNKATEQTSFAYQRKSLLARLEGGKGNKRVALLDKERHGRLIKLLK